MAVFPDRIVLKNSSDTQAQIEAAIGTGGASEITQGELVVGLEASSVSLYTLDANGGIVRFNPSSSQGRAIVSNTEPTAGVGGIPLVDGDMWFNGSDDSYYVYETGVWVQVVTSTSVPSLDDILDVSTPNLGINEDGYVLTWNDSTSSWVAGAPAALGQVSLNGITDVTYVNGVFVPAGMVEISFNTGGSTMDFRLPAGYSGNRTYDLPPDYGTSGQVLVTDGAGVMTWGNAGGAAALNDLTDVSYQSGEFFPSEMTAIKFSDSDGDTMSFSLPAGYSGNFSFSLPPNDGDADQVLSTDGSGITSWAAPMGRAVVSDVAPTTNLNGGTLVDGDLWFESDTDAYHVYYQGAWVEVSGEGGSGAGLYVQETQTASGGIIDFVNIGFSGIIQKVQSDFAAWLVLYPTSAARAADASRPFNTDPTPGSGVLFEAYIPASGTVVATPGTSYMNNDTSATEKIYAAVRDISGNNVAAEITISAYGMAAITAVSGGTFGSGV